MIGILVDKKALAEFYKLFALGKLSNEVEVSYPIPHSRTANMPIWQVTESRTPPKRKLCHTGYLEEKYVLFTINFQIA